MKLAKAANELHGLLVREKRWKVKQGEATCELAAGLRPLRGFDGFTMVQVPHITQHAQHKVEYGRSAGSFVLFHAQDTHQSEPIPSTVTTEHLKATFFFSTPLRAANNQQVVLPRLCLV